MTTHDQFLEKLSALLEEFNAEIYSEAEITVETVDYKTEYKRIEGVQPGSIEDKIGKIKQEKGRDERMNETKKAE